MTSGGIIYINRKTRTQVKSLCVMLQSHIRAQIQVPVVSLPIQPRDDIDDCPSTQVLVTMWENQKEFLSLGYNLVQLQPL